METTRQIRFIAKEKTDFFETLRTRVDEYFEQNALSKNFNLHMVIKTIVLLAGYIIPFTLLLTIQPGLLISILLWIVMGISVAGIGMSIMHDANHGSYAQNKNVNDWLGHSLNLIGGSVCNWKLQHNLLHHTYTNISGVDHDIQDRSVLKLSPHYAVQRFHQFQKYYAFLFYGIVTLYWVFAKDFIQLYAFAKSGVDRSSVQERRVMLLKILFDKFVYLFMILVVPVLFFHIPLWQVLLGFVTMHFFAGLILTVIFQLAHSVEAADYPMPNEHGTIENNWAIHQLNTTVNFSPKNKWLSWYVGGLNYQVEHHLFAKICHVHYPAIAPIVQATAKEYGVPYLVNHSFGEALHSHITLLEKIGTLPRLNEAIG
jgi:linoleoyl-CoA desaturase